MCQRSAFPNADVFLSIRIVFTLTNSVDPDEMLHYATFHLGLHCQSTYLGVLNIQMVNRVNSQISLVRAFILTGNKRPCLCTFEGMLSSRKT